jgi:hypothetical protein
MPSSSLSGLRRYDVILFKYSLIFFLILFPVLIGVSHSGTSYFGSPGKGFEFNYYSLNQIFPDIDTRYDHAGRPKGAKSLKAGLDLLTEVHIKNYVSGLTLHFNYDYPADPEYSSKYQFRAKVLFLDMPPPFPV